MDGPARCPMARRIWRKRLLEADPSQYVTLNSLFPRLPETVSLRGRSFRWRRQGEKEASSPLYGCGRIFLPDDPTPPGGRTRGNYTITWEGRCLSSHRAAARPGRCNLRVPGDTGGDTRDRRRMGNLSANGVHSLHGWATIPSRQGPMRFLLANVLGQAVGDKMPRRME